MRAWRYPTVPDRRSTREPREGGLTAFEKCEVRKVRTSLPHKQSCQRVYDSFSSNQLNYAFSGTRGKCLSHKGYCKTTAFALDQAVFATYASAEGRTKMADLPEDHDAPDDPTKPWEIGPLEDPLTVPAPARQEPEFPIDRAAPPFRPGNDPWRR
jgi:hypothetical protein